MRKTFLVSLMTLGLIITAVGTTGVIAVFSDDAETGENSAESTPRASAADLQLAVYDVSETACGTYSDDLATGPISFTGEPSGSRWVQGVLCVKNAGSSSLTLQTSAFDLVDTEDGCTNDEPAVDPDGSTCGDDGELSQHLTVFLVNYDCEGGPGVGEYSSNVASMVGTPVALDTIAAGQERCLAFELRYLTSTDDEAAASQTDKSTWKFRFTGTT